MSGAVDLSVLKDRAEARRAGQSAPPPPAGGAGAAPVPSGPVVDVTEATFERDAIEASTRQPVVVELTAALGGETAELSSVLEQLAARAGGRWVLARVDVETNPRIAQAFRAQSVPMVIALAHGQPVSAFAGAKSPSEVQTWLDDVFAQVGQAYPNLPGAPAPVEEPEDPKMVAAADKLDAGDLDGALADYREIADAEPHNVEAASLVRNLTFVARASKQPASAVELAVPGDVDSQLAAADVELLNQQPEAAFDRLVELVRATADDDRARARARLLEYFELYEPSEPVVMAARRKLASALF